MTIGMDGKRKIREFGNIKPSSDPESCGLNKPCLDVKQEREPLLGIIDTNGKIKIIVELPGVEKEEIKLSGTEDKLTISVEPHERKYFKEKKYQRKLTPRKLKAHIRMTY